MLLLVQAEPREHRKESSAVARRGDKPFMRQETGKAHSPTARKPRALRI